MQMNLAEINAVIGQYVLENAALKRDLAQAQAEVENLRLAIADAEAKSRLPPHE